MPGNKQSSADLSQLDKFKEAARQLETDDDPEHFKERLGKLVKRPVEKTPPDKLE
jgi:hypothetical protein